MWWENLGNGWCVCVCVCVRVHIYGTEVSESYFQSLSAILCERSQDIPLLADLLAACIHTRGVVVVQLTVQQEGEYSIQHGFTPPQLVSIPPFHHFSIPPFHHHHYHHYYLIITSSLLSTSVSESEKILRFTLMMMMSCFSSSSSSSSLSSSLLLLSPLLP